jgi:hypothetical protein
MSQSPDIDKEIILLKACSELISEMVNNANMTFSENDGYTEVRHTSEESHKLFLIFLVDFLSIPDQGFVGSKKSYLSNLAEITLQENPKLNPNGKKDLNVSVVIFQNWLKQEIVIEKIWFPELEIETSLTISRFEIIKLTGNYCKHNFSRYRTMINLLKDKVVDAGYPRPSDKVIMDLENVVNGFLMPIVRHQTTIISEFLNNIRWEIYYYLRPVLEKNLIDLGKVDGHRQYKYIIPNEIKSDLAKSLYWDLMNSTRCEPYVARFKTPSYLRMSY